MCVGLESYQYDWYMIIIQFQLRSIILEHALLKICICTENEGEKKRLLGWKIKQQNLTYASWKIG